jgi:hypothetical protein
MPVHDCLLETTKENIMKMRIAIFAACAGTLGLAANLAQAGDIPARKAGDTDTLATGKASTKTGSTTKPSINATSAGAGTTQTTLPSSAKTKKGVWDDTDIVHRR